jgi:phosphate transport system permease protein
MNRTRIIDNSLLFYCWFCGIFLVSSVATLLGFLLFKSLPGLNLKLLFGDVPWYQAVIGKQIVFDGIWPAMVGTFYLIVLSTIIAIPIGVSAGIYLSEYCPVPLRPAFSFLIDLLAGIPSIVMGLFGLSLVLLVHEWITPKANTCLIVSALCLAFLVLPYLIKTTQIALHSIPGELQVVGPSLGMSKCDDLWYIRLPRAVKNILSGVILAIGRCAEDTAVIMLTGVVASGGVPDSLFAKYEALPFYIFYIAAEHTSPEELARGYGASLVLLIITGMLFLLSFIIQKRLLRKW